MKELEEKKSKEALLNVQNKHILMRYQNERDEAVRLHGSGSSRGTRKEADLQDLLSIESCRSSAVNNVEGISLESPRKMQDEQEATREASWNAKGGKEEDGWRLEPEGATETPETIVLWSEVDGVTVKPDGEDRHQRVQAKSSGRESEAPGEEGEEVKSPKRKVIRVESEETQDYVREVKDPSQKGAEEISFVPSAISVPQKPLFRCDNGCSEKTISFWQFASVLVKAMACFVEVVVFNGLRPRGLRHFAKDVGKTDLKRRTRGTACACARRLLIWNVPGKHGPHGELFFFLIRKEPVTLTKAVPFKPFVSAETLKVCALIGLHLLAAKDEAGSSGGQSPDFGDMWRYGCPKSPDWDGDVES